MFFFLEFVYLNALLESAVVSVPEAGATLLIERTDIGVVPE